MARSYAQMQDFVGRLTQDETADMIQLCIQALPVELSAKAVVEGFKREDNLDPLELAVRDAMAEADDAAQANDNGE